ncbi:RagB/SusD family nutrient uptake outer membrane protein [Bacteroides sp.]|uniref:RagB/SusD family nutrient uptake outer membrane protein n=1 Tax=Bacteroides sp. TaxID=29523 RepID=UPI003AB6129F
MRRICNKLLAIAAVSVLCASCDFLDVVPQSSATIDDIYKTQNKAEQMVLSCYKEIPNYFHPQAFPDWTAGNDFVTGWYGSVRWFHFKSLLYGLESPTSTYYSLWSNTAASYPTGVQQKSVWEGIRYCYNVLNNIDRVPNIDPKKLNYYKGEALFLIGYYHQIMLEYYGPVVIVDKEIPMSSSPAEMNVPRSTYDQCVDFISNKYTEAATYLPARWPETGNYNRATAATALAYKARLLLYAASPLVNGNSEYYANFKNPDGTPLMNLTYDREKWKKAMDSAKEAIDFCEKNGYKLYGGSTSDPKVGKDNYHEAFTGPSGKFNLENWNETLFGYADQGTASYNIKNMGPRVGINQYSGEGFRGYLIPTSDCINRYYTKNGLPWADDPETKNLDPYEIAPGDSTVRLHRNREPRFYASIGFDRGEYEIQGGTRILHCRRGEEQQNDGDVSHEYQSDNGYFCQKWVSKADSYDWNSKAYTNSTYAFPFMRLAEIYLSYAEADFEYNGTLSPTSLSYLNKIRQRCGLPNFEDSWAMAGGIPTGEKLREVLHDERSIEFAMEGRRFHDIRRWKIADKEMMRKQTAWNLEGRTAEEFYQLGEMRESGTRVFDVPKSYWLAIPLDQIQINSNLVQNPGY